MISILTSRSERRRARRRALERLDIDGYREMREALARAVVVRPAGTS